jgi:hypothetical protein
MRKILLVTQGLAVSARAAADTRFEISPSSAIAGPLTGWPGVMIARNLAARGGDREPRLQFGALGMPFFGRDFRKLALAGTVEYVADADNFFPDNGVHRMQDRMRNTQNPHYESYFVYGARKGRCYAER